MLNILTIDLEDYFQVHAFSDVIQYDDWNNYECRIECNTDRLLSILNDSSIKTRSTATRQHCSTSSPNNSLTHSPIHPSSDVSQPLHCGTAALEINSQFSTQNSKLHDSLRTPHCATDNQQSTINNPIRATFFVLGWIAERYPDLVRRIQKEGHEIACHGYGHQLVYTQAREEFRQDVKRAKSILEDITGREVIGYRAPSYSITHKSQWAFEVLVEEGFQYDSSIFPIRHDFYGMPEAPRFPFTITLNGNGNFEFSMLNFEFGRTALQHRSTAAPFYGFTPNSTLNTRHSLIEFPLSTVKLFGQNVPISGGGYFRLFPYSLIRKGLRSINEKERTPFLFYMHPWEIDPDQPRIKGVSSRSRFRHYVNLDKTEGRFLRLLNDFDFSSIKQMLHLNNLITQ